MIGHKSLHDTTRGFLALSGGSHAATTAEDKAIDIRSASAVMFSHAVESWTNGVHTLTYYERSNGGAWSQISYLKMRAAGRDTPLLSDDGNGHAVTIIQSAAFDGQVLDVGYIGEAHEVKVEAVITGATTGAVYSSTARLANLRDIGNTPMTPGWPGKVQSHKDFV